MKLKKLALTLIMTIVATMATSIFSASYAATGSLYLNIKQLRNSGYGYMALEKKIWKISETNSSGTFLNNNKTIYCLRGGPGFGSTVMGSSTPTMRHYTRYFDMKEPSSITGAYASAIPSISSTKYKSLLWLLDNVYVAPTSNATSEEIANAAEYKKLLLENAGIAGGYITDDDIDVVQQLAVWYFTNNDEYKVDETFELWINEVKGIDSDYNPLSDELGDGAENGWDRADECQALFDYLVDTAQASTTLANYDFTQKASAPYEFELLTHTQEKVGNNYVIGPFKINKVNETQATLEGIFKNGGTEIKPTLQDKNGNKFNSLQETIGKEFYILIPTSTKLGEISFEISGSYFETKITYWSVEGGSGAIDQPVAVVERIKTPYYAGLKFTPDQEEFDLALRKYITSINGIAPTTSREPKITTATLNDLKNRKTTTAEKTHPKNALTVKTGDKVIYTIRVYNEGEIDGYVKQITDYLPEGLKLAQNSTINTANGWTNPLGDGKTIVTNKLEGTLLKAFDGTTLQYLDVQIECEVIASVYSGSNSLKNIAEITGHSDATGSITVTDVDSTPGNVNTNNYGTTNQEDDDDFEQLILVGSKFDLALRKFITSINGVSPTASREPKITADTLNDLKDGKITTTIKTHPKNALFVNTGDKVIYTIRVYNEGEIDGYAKEITDHLPEGLKLAQNSTINTSNGWTNPSGDGKTIVTTKLSSTLLKAFDGTNLQHADVQVECEVIASVQTSDNVLKNIAEITKHSDKDGKEVTDVDSTPGNVDTRNYGTTSQEDDDDFELLILSGKYFDLSLRKFVTAIGDKEHVDSNGKYLREPKVDVSPLLNNKTTATYKHSKVAVGVSLGDIVTYTIRVYNEGQIDGYVHEITDYLPEYLEFVNNEFNASYGWKVSGDGRTVKTTITSPDTEYSASRDTIYKDRTSDNDKVLLKAFNETSKELDYIDVKIKCKVKDTGVAKKITNIAEVTKSTDDNGNLVTDRDSLVNNITLPADSVLPEYKEDEINRGDEYIPGQEDDDDFEKVIIQKFDLSLRKFITKVNDTEISDRIPVFAMDSNKNFTYTHPKTPVEVANNDIVIYTLRVYNEGNQAGYAEEVKDDVPEGLQFLTDNELNKQYRWKMYKDDGTETTNVSEAKTIRTDYLSKEQETATGRDNLLDAFDMENMTQPDYRDVKIAFKVTEPNTSDRILINTAEISKDSDEDGDEVEDIDSTPDNDKDGEDDIDIEKVKVKYFDLALEKIVSEYSIKLNGKTTVTKTGHKFGQLPEPIVKIELNSQKIKASILKFKYQIKVTNEGEIAGYATEIKDYIPEGLKFVKSDNPKWTVSEDGKTVTTDQLKDKLLQPGESAVVEITLQWINGQTNLGLKQNWAEISKDDNPSDSPDIDSTPDNYVKEEDDIDDASIILSVTTGKAQDYILITGTVLAILSGGVVLIKKFVI